MVKQRLNLRNPYEELDWPMDLNFCPTEDEEDWESFELKDLPKVRNELPVKIGRLEQADLWQLYQLSLGTYRYIISIFYETLFKLWSFFFLLCFSCVYFQVQKSCFVCVFGKKNGTTKEEELRSKSQRLSVSLS